MRQDCKLSYHLNRHDVVFHPEIRGGFIEIFPSYRRGFSSQSQFLNFDLAASRKARRTVVSAPPHVIPVVAPHNFLRRTDSVGPEC